MMAAPFHFPLISVQIGEYFVEQYYKILQDQPDFVHQFYNQLSTIVRVDGNARQTASGMLDIHRFSLLLHFSKIEIQMIHPLPSWNGGILIVVSGSAHVEEFKRRRKFVQTFFLAPQENGYYVLNDIFHFVDEEILQKPVGHLHENNLDTKLNASPAVHNHVSNYVLAGEIQGKEFVSPVNIEENGPVSGAGYPGEQLEEVYKADKILANNFAVQSNGQLQSSMNPVQDHISANTEESESEPQKHTYASILQVAKGQPTPVVHMQSSSENAAAPPSEWQYVPEPSTQPVLSSNTTTEKFGSETVEVEETAGLEEEAEVKSVYVKNVPTTMAASEIAEEFKKFGKLKPDGVAIRTRKDLDICYAFVEFEDVAGVQSAVEATMVEIAGHQLYIEGRRPNRNSSYRGRGRGRGRGGYPTEGPRGRVGGRGFARVNGQDGGDRDYSRSRGNGYQRQTNGFQRQATRQERGFSSNQQGLRNGPISS